MGNVGLKEKVFDKLIQIVGWTLARADYLRETRRIMKNCATILWIVVFLAGCRANVCNIREGKAMKTLPIRWQRLIDEKGQTCNRCGSTEQELDKAFQSLKDSLAPLGIEVALEKKAIDPATCAKDVTQSNRIWIGERTLEDWLGGKVGKSLCGFCCAQLGDNIECRTITVGAETYEVIPAQWIIKAGLLAASHLLEVSSTEVCGQEPSSNKEQPSTCCPKSTQCTEECK